VYAVVKIKNQQYRVEPEGRLQVPRLTAEIGDQVTFEEVLLYADGGEVQLGTPTIAGASVAAEVVAHGKSRKILVFKKKRRKNYRRKKGHRQPYTEIRVTGINANV
jgi:large subunit ribosomal protein L21